MTGSQNDGHLRIWDVSDGQQLALSTRLRCGNGVLSISQMQPNENQTTDVFAGASRSGKVYIHWSYPSNEFLEWDDTVLSERDVRNQRYTFRFGLTTIRKYEPAHVIFGKNRTNNLVICGYTSVNENENEDLSYGKVHPKIIL